MNVGDFLKRKEHPLVTIGPNDKVSTAIQRLVDNNIGALPVCETRDSILGIISERDILRLWRQHGEAVGNTKVKDIMTKDLAIGVPEDDLDYVADIMTQKAVRHLPIVDGANLIGVISMRDIINVQLTECRAEVRLLNDFISPAY